MDGVQQAIKNFGNQVAMADALGISQPTISGWTKDRTDQAWRPVPPRLCIAIEIHPLNRDATTPVKRWDLRPEDWWREWPDLVGTKGAPAPTAMTKAA
ncbi:MAG TPA: YdaS family helix-turn-helix protein [Roseateles sp.]|uniref:transcriptional regulator n=1 Tax=Roseateles sp. TaxID=1971397 RepID=UPI002ED9A43C